MDAVGGKLIVQFEMNKATRHLNETFIKITVRAVFIIQPQFFQHIMGFVVKLRVEALEITEVMRVVQRVILAIG
jgi:hypothetical protein